MTAWGRSFWRDNVSHDDSTLRFLDVRGDLIRSCGGNGEDSTDETCNAG